MKLSQTTITRIIEGKIPDSLLPRPVVITHDITRTIINDTVGWTWKLVTGPNDEAEGVSITITKQEADALISRYGLIKQYENGKQLVYDTPDKDFYHKYHKPSRRARA